MIIIDSVKVVNSAIAQALGKNYNSEEHTLTALDSSKLVDVGRDVEDGDYLASFGLGMVSQIGKIVMDTRLLETDDPDIMVDTYEWGGFIERVRYDIVDLEDDPMYNLVDGKSYADVEHTYHKPKGIVKVYQEAKPLGGVMSEIREQLRETFNGASQMEKYIRGTFSAIDNTFRFKAHVLNMVIHSAAIAISNKALENAVHVLSEAKTAGIVESDVTAIQALNNRAFLAFLAKRISMIRDNMKAMSVAYNNGTIPTFTPYENSRVVLLAEIARALKFNLRADTFNPNELGFGNYKEVATWQVSKDTDESAFSYPSSSKISIAADPSNKLGIGTEAVELENCAGIIYDKYALGMSLDRFNVTSSYTACASFWNYFYHSLVNYIIDSSYSMVAIMLD